MSARPGLFAELKRRKVFRVAAAYLVVAWVVVEVASTVAPNLNLPEWTPRMVTLLVMLGFPLALVLAWIFDVTPEGVTVTESGGGNRGFYVVAAAIAVGVIAWFLYSGSADQETSVANVTEGPSIAVLPFVNMSEDASNEYFADGISEELLNILAGIEGLKVASRTSAFSFKDTNTPIPEIAELLGVRHVLEGSVRKQGNRVRITAQLIEAGEDAHLWSESYDRTLEDIFKVQEEIAQAITLALGDVLGTPRVKVQAATADLQAYERFLSGRARFHQRSELDEAIADLEYATEHDAGFAEAWIYLAAANHVAPGYSSEADITFQASMDAARSALARAKALLPGHPLVLALQANQEAHAGNRAAAMALFEQAATRRSQDSTPTLWHGLELLKTGYIEEAITVLERAHRMDPRVGINSGYLGLSYLAAGRDAEAEEQVRLSHANGWFIAVNVYAMELAARGERERAVAFLRSVTAEENVQWPGFIAFLGALENPAQAGDFLEMLEMPAAFNVPEVLIALERQDQFLAAAEAFTRGAADTSAWWLRMVWQPSSSSVREDPRFFEIARELGLVELWETRGYPPGCSRVAASAGDRLDCPGMRR